MPLHPWLRTLRSRFLTRFPLYALIAEQPGRPRPRPSVEVLEDRTVPAVATWVGGSGDWDTACNWDTNQVPGAADDAVINTPGITVTHASSESIHNLSLSGATLDGPGTVAVGGSLTLFNGTLSGGGSLTAGTGMSLGGTSTLDGFTLAYTGLAGTLTGNLSLFNGGVLDNEGSLVVDGAGVVRRGDSSAVMLLNRGRITKSGAGEAGLLLPIDSDGSITLNAGALDLGDHYGSTPSTFRGPVTGDAGTLLYLTGGGGGGTFLGDFDVDRVIYYDSAPYSFQGDYHSNWTQTNGTVSMAGPVADFGQLNVGGTVAFSSPTTQVVTATCVILQSGALVGDGNLILNDSGPFSEDARSYLNLTLGVSYDQITVEGPVSLAGALQLSLAPGFSPTLNQSFLVLDSQGSAGISGAFAGASLTLSDGTQLSISYQSGGVVLTVPITTHNLQTALDAAIQQSGQGAAQMTLDVPQGTLPDVLQAVEQLTVGTDPAEPNATLTLNLGAGTYGGQTVDVPDNLTLVLVGADGNTVFVGASPAFTVTSGLVLIRHVTFTNATNAPAILVSGGSLTLRDCVVQESTGYAQSAIRVTSGTLDLGTTADPGNNTLNVNGQGELIRNTGANSISAIGDTWAVNGVALPDGYAIEDRVFHALDAGGGGLVSYVAGNVYVTPSSGSIQRGVNAVAAGGTVNVQSGSNYAAYTVGSKLLTVSFQDGGSLSLQPNPQDPTLTDLVVLGTVGNDKLLFNPHGNTGAIDVAVNGLPVATIAPTGRLIAHGLAGDDDIQVAGSISLPAWLYGDDGNDRLKGGNGNNVLIGGVGDDLLVGGDGRDLLIGGTGADRLIGNGADDILIGGTTAYDGNEGALGAIMAEWTSSHSFATRVANLTDTGSGLLLRLNRDYFLLTSGAGQTVFNDSSNDTLTGWASSDWFFAGSADKITDLTDADKAFVFGT